MLAFCVAVCVALLIATPTTTSTFTDGLYTSNGTDILKVTGSDVTSIYKSASGRIVGLAYSYSDNYMFWSDISLVNRGIYRATVDSSGNLGQANKTVSDVLEVNGLTVDWLSRHIYWTDGRRRTVEVADFDGNNRRILITERLSQPRGIYADPTNRYLFWNDQGYHQIERSRLDGSERRILVRNNTDIYWPNQMTVADSKLYWVDSKYKTLVSVTIQGSGRKSVSLGALVGTGHVYGLTIFANKAYISGWKSNVSMIEVQLPDGAPAVFQSGLSSGPVFSNAYVSSSLQSSRGLTDPCAGHSCALCLPTSSSYRCSCPSYGGKVLNEGSNQCDEPRNVVLYTLAESGYVGFYDPAAAKNGDLYFVARSLRPVGVAYDPVEKYVYWSDVRERTIRRVKLDGTNAAVLLDSSKGIGVVDGLALDHVNRRLYYTNIGSMTVENEEYSWHKVETVRVDTLSVKVRTVVSSYADRPRAIAISNGYLYYTDWGKTASVVRTQLDGTSPTVIKMGLNNPNGIAIIGNKIYVTDSNYKTRVPANARTGVDGSIYSMNLNDGSGWTDVLSSSTKLKTPFGLTTDGQKLYVTDWDKKAIFEVDVSRPTAAVPEVIGDVGLPMSVEYSAVSVTRPSDPCSSSSCDDVCIPRGSSATCTCNSYKNHRLSSSACTEPGSYLLVADMDGVKMVSVDGSDEKSVYVAAVGRPFLSNLVALAYDPSSKIAYYSDVARKAIYALTLSNSTSTEFYRVNHIIDGLTLHGGKLYWTDASNGLIASLDISSPKQHEVLKTGLDKPRAIVVTDSHIYWTEWGSNPRVARMSISSTSSDETISSNHKWPNALFVKDNMLYIAESHETKRRLVKCSLTGVSNCQPITNVNSAIVEHMYDIWVSNNDLLIYTDWKNKSVNMLSLTTGTLLRPLATGLMRPSQLLFVGTDRPSGSPCRSGHGCNERCSPLFGSQQCVCNAGQLLNGSTSTCVDGSSLSCTYDGKSYGVGTSDIKKSACVSCQCLPRTLYSSTTDGLICHAIQCPVPDCQNPSVPAGQCCPVCGVPCGDGGVEITNCPSGVVRVSLPANRDDVIYRFVPTTRDCSEQGHTVTTTKTPRGNIYQWNGDEGHDVSVTASAGGSSVTCDFKVVPVDTTRPTITCPDDVLVYTEADKTTVDFPAPLVSDNVGVEPGQVTSSPARGSEFSVDTTPVIYTARDRAGLQASCSFNVQVRRYTSSCVVPHLQRGHLRCSSASSSFTCVTECHSSYRLKPGTAVSQITCSGGQWSPQIPDDFEHFTCVKTVAGTVQGSISVTVGNVCSRGGGQLHTDYTEEVLEYRIEVNYLTPSFHDLSSDVTVSDCGAGGRRRRGANDVIVTVVIVGVYEREDDRESVRQEIEYNLQRIQEDLLRGFLVVPLRDDNGIWTAAIVTADKDVTIVPGGCPSGSYKDETARICILCPAGTHLSGSECVPCEKGTYNDRDGQDACTDCPDGKSDSPAGSDSIDQCEPSGGLSTMLIIIIVVVIIVVILLIIVIVVVVLCVRRRRASPSGGTDHKYSNQAFEENNYDIIHDDNYEPMAAKEPDHPYSSISEKTQ